MSDIFEARHLLYERQQKRRKKNLDDAEEQAQLALWRSDELANARAGWRMLQLANRELRVALDDVSKNEDKIKHALRDAEMKECLFDLDMVRVRFTKEYEKLEELMQENVAKAVQKLIELE